MSRAMRLAMILCAVSFPACQSPPQKAWDEEAVRGGVEEAVRAYERSFNQKKWEETLKLYAEDGRFYWVEDGRVAYPSYRDLAATVRSFYPTMQDVQFEVTSRRITPLSADLAHASFGFSSRFVMGPEQELKLAGIVTGVLQKKPEGWQFIVGHASTQRDRPSG